MTTAFQSSAFQNNAFQIDDGVVTTRTSGVKRKLRIYPDGKRRYATEQEAVDALLLYHHEQKLKASESAVLGLTPKKRKKIILPHERVEINAALETLKDSDARQLLRRREEEWLLLLH